MESDIIFNGEDHLWSDSGAADRYDVRNIATHEIGHSVGLNDLYSTGDSEKTMYGHASLGETKKRSLHSDDINGARYVNFDPQTSGTLAENQIWIVCLDGNTVNLSGDLTIPIGRSITINSGVTVNFGSYSVIPDIQIKQSGALRGLYPTIQTALNASTTGQQVELSGIYTLDNNTTIATSKTLVLKSSTILTMSTFNITTSSGTITVESGAYINKDVRLKQSGVIKGLYPTVQAGINACASNQVVYLKAGAYTENISMTDYSYLKGAGRTLTDLYGTVTFNNVDGAILEDLRVSQDITISSGDNNWIDNVTAADIIDIENGVNHMVYECWTGSNGYVDIYCTDPEIEDLTSTNTKTWGVVGYGSDPLITYGTFENKTRAVHLGSSMDADIDNVDFCTQSGASEYDIYASPGSHADVVVGSGTFSECPFPNSFYGDCR
ncbi:matrixin family metalloprotease [candidate division KSB1 bacterium]|nr:matrixin family metalloprotease [candidate division KSB1 bacterium]